MDDEKNRRANGIAVESPGDSRDRAPAAGSGIVKDQRLPTALEPFLDAFVDMIVEDLLCLPPDPKP